jgi:hypothetical protein
VDGTTRLQTRKHEADLANVAVGLLEQSQQRRQRQGVLIP